MLYLKNSLVNLIILLFSLFFVSILSAEDSNFIFPKKKIIVIKAEKKSQKNIKISIDLDATKLPQKNPLRKSLPTKGDLIKNAETSDLLEKKEVLNKTVPQEQPKTKQALQNN